MSVTPRNRRKLQARTFKGKRTSGKRAYSKTSLSRKSNRRAKTGFWQSIKTANRRAHQRSSNQRDYERRNLKSIKAAIAEGTEPDYSLGNLQLILRTFIGILLLFPCFISTIALFNLDNTGATSHYWTQLIKSAPFQFFAGGADLMLIVFFLGLFRGTLLYLYVLGHELTHALFIYLCGGWISEFKVTREGGFVVTNKTNILIALSPYFVPFWSIIVLLISMLLERFFTIPFHQEILYLLIGATWAFHLTWTIWMIPRDQPDLKENGSFFSLTIIYLVNVLLLAFLFCIASKEYSFTSYLNQWLHLFQENAVALKLHFSN